MIGAGPIPGAGRRAGQAGKAHMPGEPAVWTFIGGDLAVFTLFFATFVASRGAAPALYATAQSQLNQGYGVLNAALLLTSSLFVALGVQAARAGAARAGARLLWGGIACGGGFVLCKVFEWSEKFRAGLSVTANEFYTFYFMFTGIHLVHVLIGLAILVWIARAARGAPNAGTMRLIESGASFWHLVDLLWIVLFALLYLLP